MCKNRDIILKLLRTIVILMLMTVVISFPVYAEEETGTAGSSLGKEVLEEPDEEIEENDSLTRSAKAARATGWVQDNVGWRYYFSNGQYYKNTWFQNPGDNQWYWFESDGYIAKGWRKVKGAWHYFKDSGYWVEQSQYSKYENGTLKGIDVSKWQANINWQAVKQDGIQFAFVRLGASGKDQNLDPYFEKNMKEAKQAGIPVGVYYYSKATTVDMAIKEAQFTINHMKGYLVSYPVVIDVEDTVQQNLGKNNLAKIIKAFCDEIRAAGYTPMLYTNENWYRNYINMNMLAGEELWVARYNYYYDTAIPRGIWQSSSTSRVNGVSGNVDINFGYKDYTRIVTPRTSALPSYANSSGQWITDSRGKWYQYYGGGYPANKWEQIRGKWYWFDKNGYVTTGWQSIWGLWYYMDSSGAMTTGWQYVGGRWYYMNSSGAMLTGWQSIGGQWYYLSSSGVMLTGWQDIGGQRYYLSASGAMVRGWVKINGVYYYLSNSGAMVRGWVKINGIYYYLSDTGVMVTGWQNIGGQRYYFNASGAMVTGRQYIDGKYYEFGSDGSLKNDSSGGVKAGWQYIGGKWYYINSSGTKLTGWQYIGNHWYYLDSSGVMLTGWQDIGGQRYYLSASGAMVRGWVKINGVYYYLSNSGAMVRGWVKINGIYYYLSDTGVMVTGWQNIGGQRYYFNASGAMVTGRQYIGGKYYNFKSDGSLI